MKNVAKGRFLLNFPLGRDFEAKGFGRPGWKYDRESYGKMKGNGKAGV
jgi:hypothetical protein